MYFLPSSDVNECHEEGLCPPPGKCVNLLGSFRCVCPRGFRLDLAGARCLDRDECADGRCQSPCRNYAGGYRCDCPAGMLLHIHTYITIYIMNVDIFKNLMM